MAYVKTYVNLDTFAHLHLHKHRYVHFAAGSLKVVFSYHNHLVVQEGEAAVNGPQRLQQRSSGVREQLQLQREVQLCLDTDLRHERGREVCVVEYYTSGRAGPIQDSELWQVRWCNWLVKWPL